MNFNIRENFYKKTDVYIVEGEWINMSETFKINIYFDEKGEELEELIKHLIINILKKNIFWTLKFWDKQDIIKLKFKLFKY